MPEAKSKATTPAPGSVEQKSFGERVVERMHELHITTTELSRVSGVSEYVVRNLHSGRRKTTGADNAQKLIAALGLGDGTATLPAPVALPQQPVAPFLADDELLLLGKAVDLYVRVNEEEKPYEVKALKGILARLRKQ